MDNALAHRIEAIELFLQQLVFLLEVEKDMTAENMAAWLIKCRDLQRLHRVTTAPVLAAFGDLIDRVGLPAGTQCGFLNLRPKGKPMKIETNPELATVTLDIRGTYTAEQLLDVLHQIGKARAEIAQDPANPTGIAIPTVNSPSYWTQFGPSTNVSLLAFRHPGYGWIGFTVPLLETARMAAYLNNHLVIALSPPAPPTAAGDSPAFAALEGGGLLH